MICRRESCNAAPFAGIFVLAVWSALPSSASAQALLGTVDDSLAAVGFPSPGVGLPTPANVLVPALPVDFWPHGVAICGGYALMADFAGSRVSVVEVEDWTIVRTYNTPTFDGTGSIEIDPTCRYALAIGSNFNENGVLTVIEHPFAALPVQTSWTLPSSMHVHSWQTQAIEFAANGRAFIAVHSKAWDPALPTTTPNASQVIAIDPPYTAAAFAIPLPAVASNYDHAEGLALSPDESTLLVGTFFAKIWIVQAPFSAGSTVLTRTTASTPYTSSVAITPDGGTAIVSDYFTNAIGFVSAPFNASSAVQATTLPTGGYLTNKSLEHVAIDRTGSLAILTGQSLPADDLAAVFLEAPFTSAGVTRHAVAVADGRGAGAVEFVTDLVFRDAFESGDETVWSVAVGFATPVPSRTTPDADEWGWRERRASGAAGSATVPRIAVPNERR